MNANLPFFRIGDQYNKTFFSPIGKWIELGFIFQPKTSIWRYPQLNGATTLSIMTFSIVTLSIIVLFATPSLNDTQHNDTQHNDTQHNITYYGVPLCRMSRFLLLYWVPLFWVLLCWSLHELITWRGLPSPDIKIVLKCLPE